MGASLVLAAGVAAAASVMQAAAPPENPVGGLRQLAGRERCLLSGGGLSRSRFCTGGHAFPEPSMLVLSPDGRNLYVPGAAIAVFRRNPRSGALSHRAAVRCLSWRGRLAVSTIPAIMTAAAGWRLGSTDPGS